MTAHQKALPLLIDSPAENRIVTLRTKHALTVEIAEEIRFLEDYLKWKNRREQFPHGEPSVTTFGPGQRKPRRHPTGAGTL